MNGGIITIVYLKKGRRTASLADHIQAGMHQSSGNPSSLKVRVYPDIGNNPGAAEISGPPGWIDRDIPNQSSTNHPNIALMHAWRDGIHVREQP
jgi:hypothetical protein